MTPKVFSILITGANRGLGLEFVRQLSKAESPPQFIFAACRGISDDLKKLADNAPKTTKIHVVQLDVTNDQLLEKAVKEVQSIVGDKGLTLIINNSGILLRDGAILPNVTRANLQEHFNVNTTSAILVTQAFLPLLKKSAAYVGGSDMSIYRGAIVNISSFLGSIASSDQGSADFGFSYKCSKAALNMFTKCIAEDLKSDGILCISMCPGWVQTDMGSSKAVLTPEESIGCMLKTFCELNSSFTGSFLNQNCEPYNW